MASLRLSGKYWFQTLSGGVGGCFLMISGNRDDIGRYDQEGQNCLPRQNFKEKNLASPWKGGVGLTLRPRVGARQKEEQVRLGDEGGWPVPSWPFSGRTNAGRQPQDQIVIRYPYQHQDHLKTWVWKHYIAVPNRLFIGIETEIKVIVHLTIVFALIFWIAMRHGVGHRSLKNL